MIHGDNPFVDDAGDRDPLRRFRGRLSAPVTIVTTGSSDAPTGLTVSSLLVIEGNPGVVQMVVTPTSDLWSALTVTRRFIVHICTVEDRHLAEVFAGVRPSPGGPFSNLDVSVTGHGVTLDRLTDRLYCRFVEKREQGHAGVVVGEVDNIEIRDLLDPLVYFRGRFRTLA